MNQQFRKFWKVFKDKGPVNIPGAQVQYRIAAKHVLPHLLVAEVRKLQVAHGHATSAGESRNEWDAVCKEIEKRIGGER